MRAAACVTVDAQSDKAILPCLHSTASWLDSWHANCRNDGSVLHHTAIAGYACVDNEVEVLFRRCVWRLLDKVALDAEIEQ